MPEGLSLEPPADLVHAAVGQGHRVKDIDGDGRLREGVAKGLVVAGVSVAATKMWSLNLRVRSPSHLDAEAAVRFFTTLSNRWRSRSMSWVASGDRPRRGGRGSRPPPEPGASRSRRIGHSATSRQTSLAALGRGLGEGPPHAVRSAIGACAK